MPRKCDWQQVDNAPKQNFEYYESRRHVIFLTVDTPTNAFKHSYTIVKTSYELRYPFINRSQFGTCHRLFSYVARESDVADDVKVSQVIVGQSVLNETLKYTSGGKSLNNTLSSALLTKTLAFS